MSNGNSDSDGAYGDIEQTRTIDIDVTNIGNNSGNEIIDELFEDTMKTFHKMGEIVANGTSEVTNEIVDGDFGVKGTNRTVPVEEHLLSFERTLVDYYEPSTTSTSYRRVSPILGDTNTNNTSNNRMTMLMRVNDYSNKEHFVIGAISMAAFFALIVAVVLAKHAKKYRRAIEEEYVADDDDDDDEEASNRNKNKIVVVFDDGTERRALTERERTKYGAIL
jgi:hypothetical protein